jgi:hypothetical protein
MIEPVEHGGEENKPEEGAGKYLVACGNAAMAWCWRSRGAGQRAASLAGFEADRARSAGVRLNLRADRKEATDSRRGSATPPYKSAGKLRGKRKLRAIALKNFLLSFPA